MPWNSIADRALKAAMRPFREPATYTPVGGAPESISGVFAEEPIEVEVGAGAPVISSRIVFSVRLAELSAPPSQGARLRLRGQDHRVTAVEHDSPGVGAKLVLHRIHPSA